MVLLQLLAYCAGLEFSTFDRPLRYFGVIALFGGALYLARWRTASQAETDDLGVQFEDQGSPAIQGLGLSR
jgi:hypothetical protein